MLEKTRSIFYNIVVKRADKRFDTDFSEYLPPLFAKIILREVKNMKKLLCMILAAMTVVSANVFAAPSVEVAERADENVYGTETVLPDAQTAARLNDESIDYNAPLYGVKSFCEDYERFEANADLPGWILIANADDASKPHVLYDFAGVSEKKIYGNDANKYAQITTSGSWPALTFDTYTDYFNVMTSGTQVTVLTDMMMTSEEFPKLSYNRHGVNYSSAGFQDYNKTDGAKADEWFTQVTTVTVPENDSVKGFRIAPVLTGAATICFDNIAVYYKPAASAEYTAVLDYPTLTVSAPGGIETEAAKALCDSPARYFGNAVSACAINGETMTLTLNINSDAAEVVIPSLVNADKSAAYNEKTVEIPSADYKALLYGVKSFCEDYERDSLTAGAELSGWKVDDYVWHLYDGADTKTILADENGKYLAFTFDGSKQNPYIMFGAVTGTNHFSPLAAGAQITMMSDVLIPEDAFEKVDYVQHMTQYEGDANALPHNSKPENQVAGEWFTQVTTFTVPSGKNVSSFKFAPGLTDVTGNQTIYFDNLAVYYKPAATLEPTVSISGNTVTAVYSEAIESEAAKALSLYYKNYFGDAVSALTVSGDSKTVTVTLSDGASKITLPVLVNAAKTASYAGVTADLKAYNPVSVDEKEVRLTSDNSGLRFKAYVLNENIPVYTEFGYVVALEQTLQNAGLSASDLKIGLENVKYLQKAAYKSDGSANYIYNKNYLDSTATLFTGVLTGIPAGKYHLNLVARPYALKSDGTYVYGESMVGNVKDVALALKNDEQHYNSLSDAEKALIDSFVNNIAG